MNRLRKGIPLLVAIISFVLVAATGLWAQKTIHVPSDVTTIQAAIDASQDGDTVLVSAGTYSENINFHGKAITLTSASGPANTIIDGGAKATVVTFNSGEGLKSVLNGFTIQNGWNSFKGAGLEVLLSSPTIVGNVITNNHAITGIGIDVGGGSPVIKNNRIEANTMFPNSEGTGGGGIQVSGYVDSPASPTIIGNTIINNFSGSGGGLMVSYYGRPVIQSNLIAGNTALVYGGGISIQNYDGAIVSQNLVLNNTVTGFGAGIAIEQTPGVLLISNTIVGNTASDHSSGIYISPSDIGADTIANNLVVVAASETAVVCYPEVSHTSPLFRHNDFFSPDGAPSSGICDLTVGGNISVDPKFVNAVANDFHLQVGSPAIDAGDNSVLNLPQQDKDGNVRIVDGNNDCVSTVDLGAYELQASAQGVIGPTSLSFPEQIVGTAGNPMQVSVSSTGSTCLQILAFTISSDFTQTNNCGLGVPAGNNCTIGVRFQPMAVGLRTGTVTVSTNSSNAIPAVALSGTGLTGAPVLSPGSVSFGNVVIGSKASQTVTLKASGPGPLTIASITASPDFTQTNKCPTTLNLGSSCKITISFKPGVVGVVNGSLTVSDNGLGSPQSVSLSGTGVKKR